MTWKTIIASLAGAAFVIAGMEAMGVPNDIPVWRHIAGLALIFGGISIWRIWR